MTLLSGVVSLFSNNFTDNIRVVPDNVTVQQVIDSITDASLTNKYLIVIPSGHETETFSYKPGLEFYFLDGTGRKPIYEELEGWSDLDNWSYSGLSLSEISHGFGNNSLKVTISDSSLYNQISIDPIDLRGWHGLLVSVKITNISTYTSPPLITLRIYPNVNGYSSDNMFRSVSSFHPLPAGSGGDDCYVNCFFPFNYDIFHGNYISDLNFPIDDCRLRIEFGGNVDGIEYEFLTMSLVRTTPFPSVFIRCDDSRIDNSYRLASFRHVHDFFDGRVCWAVIANEIHLLTSDNNSLTTAEILHDLCNNNIVDIANHSLTHPDFASISANDTIFEVDASQEVFRRLGISAACNVFVNPYGSTNTTLLNTFYERGIISLYSAYSGVVCGAVLQNVNTVDDYLLQSKFGGIFCFLYHGSDIDTETKYQDFIEGLEAILQTRKIINLEDVMCMTSKKHQCGTSLDSILQDSLLDNLDTKFYTDTYILDPNGADRNLTPFQYGYKAGDKHLIINSGSANNLVFDPSGLNFSIAPGNSATVLYDGSNWRQV